METRAEPVGILGAGGQAAEVADYLEQGRVRFHAVSAEFLQPGGDLVDVETTDPALLEVAVVAAVGAPFLRRQLVANWRGERFATVVSASSFLARTAVLGTGAILAPHSSVSARVVVGLHAIINVGASIAHDSVLGDYVTVSPGARVGGRVHIGDGAFIGIGASIVNGVRIAPGTVVGAGACVLADTVENGTYVGTPARCIAVKEDWLREI